MKIVYSNEVNQSSHYGYAGLKNLGNICYMNSMIQQLFSNKTFRYLLHRINDQKQP
jgi:ubiquitin carboxyl-terminal hydrolase 34